MPIMSTLSACAGLMILLVMLGDAKNSYRETNFWAGVVALLIWTGFNLYQVIEWRKKFKDKDPY